MEIYKLRVDSSKITLEELLKIKGLMSIQLVKDINLEQKNKETYTKNINMITKLKGILKENKEPKILTDKDFIKKPSWDKASKEANILVYDLDLGWIFGTYKDAVPNIKSKVWRPVGEGRWLVSNLLHLFEEEIKDDWVNYIYYKPFESTDTKEIKMDVVETPKTITITKKEENVVKGLYDELIDKIINKMKINNFITVQQLADLDRRKYDRVTKRNIMDYLVSQNKIKVVEQKELPSKWELVS